MQSTRIIRIVLICLCVGLVAFLFVNGMNNSTALADDKVHANAPGAEFGKPATFDFAALETNVIRGLDKDKADEVMKLKGRLQGRGPMQDNLRQLAKKYEDLMQPALAGYYYQKLTETEPSEENWFQMGRNYYLAEGDIKDPTYLAYFTDLSIGAFKKALKINPRNFEAKTDLAANYIESRQDVMTGVGLLKEVVSVDSNNRNALFYLGYLSMQSGQYPKAAARFEKLISLGPEGDRNYPFYMRYLGDAYKAEGDKPKARAAYEKYSAMISGMKDENLKKEASNLLESVQ
jgi:tetratricopeptide (TPR) repeat protein